jgi:hypothetical protein
VRADLEGRARARAHRDREHRHDVALADPLEYEGDVKRLFNVLFGITAIAGCSSPGSNAIPAGIYGGAGELTGTSTLNGARQSFDTRPSLRGIVTAGGDYLFMSYETGSPDTVSQLDIGTGSASDGMFTASDDLELALQSNYDTSPGGIGSIVQNGRLTAQFSPMSTFTATIDYPPNNGGQSDDELTFPATWVAGSVAAPTLAQVASTYTGAFSSNINTSGYGDRAVATGSITIATSGELSGTILCVLGSTMGGTDAPCTVSGTISPRADVDAYDVTLSFASGSGSPPAGGFLPSSWTGKTASGMAYVDPASGKLVLGAAAPDNTGFAFAN